MSGSDVEDGERGNTLPLFDKFILIVIYVRLFFYHSSTVSLGPFHRPLHLSGVSLQSSDNIVEMFLRPDL